VTLNPPLITADGITQPYDTVLLTVKGFQLEAALADLARATGPETMILPVLNGMRHMDILAGRFSEHNLVGCALKVATVIEEDGRMSSSRRCRIRHTANWMAARRLASRP
jgi:2-dehydropantoate 2-reductase